MKQPNQYTKEEDKLKPGPIYISDIPDRIRRTGIFTKQKDEECFGSYQQDNKLRRSKRIRSRNNNDKSEFKIICNHNSDRKCFINHKRIEKQSNS